MQRVMELQSRDRKPERDGEGHYSGFVCMC